MIKTIKYFLQSIIIYLFFLICRILGLKISRIIFAYIFTLIGPYFKSKKIIKNNLNIFSEITEDLDEKEIEDCMWKNYGMTFVEYVFLNHFRKGNSRVVIKGEENLNGIIKGQKPVIFVSGHFANFELMSMEITKKKHSLGYYL